MGGHWSSEGHGWRTERTLLLHRWLQTLQDNLVINDRETTCLPSFHHWPQLLLLLLLRLPLLLLNSFNQGLVLQDEFCRFGFCQSRQYAMVVLIVVHNREILLIRAFN